MSIRNVLGGLLVVLGCSTTMLIAAAMLLSMQLETGTGLLYGVAGLGGGVAMLALAALVLVVLR